MQIIFDSQNKSVVRMEKGEDCLDVLKSLAEEKDKSFNFSIIGAGSLAELGYYDLVERKYLSKIFVPEHIEIISVIGNITWYENKPVVHAHGVFSNENYETFGGHIVKLIISLTGETIIDWLPEKIIKKYDEKTGLKLLYK